VNVVAPFAQVPALCKRFDPFTACVLVLGRNSLNGKVGRRGAIDDLFHALDRLARHGVDARPHMPGRDELDQMLRDAAPVTSKDKNGRSFFNRFVEIDLRDKCGVYILLSTGTARKLDVDDETQPWISRATAITRAINPSLIYARRIDRIVRKAWALGPLMLALDDGWIGDERRGIRQVNGIEGAIVFFDATASEEEAEKFISKGPQGINTRSGRRMENGQVLYAAGNAPPPGFGVARLSSGSGRGPQIMYLDDCISAPPTDKVAYGLSTVEVNGQAVSQVENVRFLLRNVGRPEWPATRLLNELVARGFSSTGLRRHNMDPGRIYPRDHVQVGLNAVLRELDLYETGVMDVHLTPEDLSFKIHNCLPADGRPWASTADFVRARQYLADGSLRFDSFVRLILAGTAVTIDGSPARLGTADRKPRTKPPTHYVAWSAPTRNMGRYVRPGTPTIDAFEINLALIDAIARAGDTALDLVDTSAPDTEEVIAARTEVRDLQTTIATLEAQEARLRARSMDQALEGSALLKALAEEYERLSVTLSEAKTELTTASARLDAAKRAAVIAVPQLRADALLKLVNTLRDPKIATYRMILRKALGDSVELTNDPTAQTWTLEATLTFGTDDYEATVPVHRIWSYAKTLPHFDTDEIFDRFEAGELFSDVCPKYLIDVVIEASGVDGDRAFFVTCTDPRIQRIGIAVSVRRRGRTNAQIATDLNEPEVLVDRVESLWAEGAWNRVWRRKGGASLRARLFIDAANAADGAMVVTRGRLDHTAYKAYHQAANLRPKDWEKVRAGIRMRPCDNCGSTARVPVVIKEPDSSICLCCRQDRSGIKWPADPYDGYVQELQMFIDAGLVAKTATSVPLRKPQTHLRPERTRGGLPRSYPPAELDDHVAEA
jgi:hypothetical protein